MIADDIEKMAIAIYDTDEDMTDERVTQSAALGEILWSEQLHPRVCWTELSSEIQEIYRRRSRAALAALNYNLELL